MKNTTSVSALAVTLSLEAYAALPDALIERLQIPTESQAQQIAELRWSKNPFVLEQSAAVSDHKKGFWSLFSLIPFS
jgi:hypothetical protein